jgi:hypothetical protein
MGGGAGAAGISRPTKGASGVNIGATFTDVDAPGVKLMHNRSLTRESTLLACLGASTGVEHRRWRACDYSVFVSCSERDGGGSLDVPPPARGANMVVLPWLGETVADVRWVSRRVEYCVIAEANSHELDTPEPDRRV